MTGKSHLGWGKSLGVLVGTAVVVLAGASVAGAWVGEYDASLGTLPQAQGWVFSGSMSPSPTVSSGILYQGPTSVPLSQNWMRSDKTFSFSDFVLETRVKVVNADYDQLGTPPNEYWRSPYIFFVGDNLGRFYGLGITDTGVILTNNYPWGWMNDSTSFVARDTTSAFNTYRLEVAGGTGTLYVNGSSVASLTVGSTGEFSTNRVGFGDFYDAGSSQTQLEYVQFTPEPATLSLLALGGLVLLRRRGK